MHKKGAPEKMPVEIIFTILKKLFGIFKIYMYVGKGILRSHYVSVYLSNNFKRYQHHKMSLVKNSSQGQILN